MTQAPKQDSPWIPPDSVPPSLQTERFVLEPLDSRHAELDFEALMSCRERLREELQWGNWPPPDFTLGANRLDLTRHYGEFQRGEAFAYTVLSPDQSRCLGCIYLERGPQIDAAQFAFWVVDNAIEMESYLFSEILRWVHTAWPVKRIIVPLRDSNSRGIGIAQNGGLVPWDSRHVSSLCDHRCFLSEAP